MIPIHVRTLIWNLTDKPRRNELARHSFRNYHVMGLDYLCLLRNERLTVKAYFFDGVTGHMDTGWIVWPHNHAYAFEHWTLKGRIRHHHFQLAVGDDWWLHHYDAEERRPRPLMRVGLNESCPDTLVPGDGYFAMTPDEMHTLSLPDGNAVALQIQYHDRRDGGTIMVARSPEVACGNNQFLYLPMSETLVAARLKSLRGILLGEGDAQAPGEEEQ